MQCNTFKGSDSKTVTHDGTNCSVISLKLRLLALASAAPVIKEIVKAFGLVASVLPSLCILQVSIHVFHFDSFLRQGLRCLL
jgi:hypothetical protein